jgi:L-fuconolactonase
MIVDAHQHFWHPARGEYGWIQAGDAVLDRVWGPGDLTPLMAQCRVSRTVLVQAASTVAESDYMLGLADATPFVAGVVGWIDFQDAGHLTALRRLARHPTFRGVRPPIQDFPDAGWMFDDDVQWAYRAICDLGLTFDALGFPRHLDPFLRLMKRYPQMPVVIDHGMKPQIRDPSEASFARWADGMARIAGETRACCKFSGLVTEAGVGWTIDDLRPYADHILKVFGPGRIMWGSDWPVCGLAGGYEAWFAAAQTLSAGLPPEAQDQIFGGTAERFYGL